LPVSQPVSQRQPFAWSCFVKLLPRPLLVSEPSLPVIRPPAEAVQEEPQGERVAAKPRGEPMALRRVPVVGTHRQAGAADEPLPRVATAGARLAPAPMLPGAPG